MAVLSTKERKSLPKKDFALPSTREGGKGGYPIPDENHARNALARVHQFGSPAEIAEVRAKVGAKFPHILQAHDKANRMSTHDLVRSTD